MMKVSHPIVFGHAVKVFYKEAFAKHGKLFDELGVNVNNGMVNLYDKIADAAGVASASEIIRDLHACHENRPELAMVDSAKGISNLHAPERRDRRRVDAGDDPRRRQDVGRRRPPEGHQGGDPGEHVRAHLPGDHQLLQDQRRLRPGDHGHGAERRPDGAAGRGIRLARQDLRDPRGRRRPHRRHRQRRGAAGAERRDRRHLAHVPGQGRARSATGSSWR